MEVTKSNSANFTMNSAKLPIFGWKDFPTMNPHMPNTKCMHSITLDCTPLLYVTNLVKQLLIENESQSQPTTTNSQLRTILANTNTKGTDRYKSYSTVLYEVIPTAY